jgi:lipopolysaccharide transport system ATP-binding protein
MSDTLIKVEGISKKFCHSLKKSLWYGMQDLGREITGRRHGGEGELRPEEFWAVKDVSFELKRGECLGLIGPNGAGKSTLLKMLNGLIKPDQGRIEMHGRIGPLIELGAGFNPILTGRENIYVNGAVLGFTKKEIDQKLDEIIEFAEIGKFIDAPVQSYSSGMKVRLGFAIAAQMEPDVLLIDEVLAVGDIGFRSKCYSRLAELVENCAVIFVSHQMYFINRLCSSAMLLKSGQKICMGEPAQAISRYNALFSQEGKVISGDQETRIENLRLLDKSNHESDAFDWRDPLIAELDLLTSRANEEVALSVTFMGMDGAIAAQCHSSYNNFKVRNAYERNRVRLEIDRLNLNPSVYYINLIVYDKTNNRQLLWLYATKKFEVTGDFCGGASFQYEGHWQVADASR